MMKKVKEHLKDDMKMFKREGSEDKKLMNQLSKYDKINDRYAKDKNGLMEVSKKHKKKKV